MSDLIDRQAAIAAVSLGALSAATVYGRTDAGATALRETIKVINALPAARQWIPVTAGLPEQTGKYLVSVKNGNVYAGTYDSYGRQFQCAAVAWMPLPEPYKEGE